MGIDNLLRELLRQPAIQVCERECGGFKPVDRRTWSHLPWVYIGHADSVPGSWKFHASMAYRTEERAESNGESIPIGPVVYLRNTTHKPHNKPMGWYAVPIDELTQTEAQQ